MEQPRKVTRLLNVLRGSTSSLLYPISRGGAAFDLSPAVPQTFFPTPPNRFHRLPPSPSFYLSREGRTAILLLRFGLDRVSRPTGIRLFSRAEENRGARGGNEGKHRAGRLGDGRRWSTIGSGAFDPNIGTAKALAENNSHAGIRRSSSLFLAGVDIPNAKLFRPRLFTRSQLGAEPTENTTLFHLLPRIPCNPILTNLLSSQLRHRLRAFHHPE